jgi:uncharacterized protein (TIGR03492 family)
MNDIRLENQPEKALFISNGHGEDLNASQIAKALRQQQPQLEIGAMPIVGQGNAYRNLGIEIIGPTEALPSGGFIYNDRVELVKDIRSGLFTLLWRQIQAIRNYSRNSVTERLRQRVAVFAVGDVVSILGAYLTGNPYVAFLVSSSAHYENRMKFPLVVDWLLKSDRCKIIFTRDKYTADILNSQGFSKAMFAGYPVMDVLEITGKDLQLLPDLPLVALLPGSRLPEAGTNLQLLLDLAIETTPKFPEGIQFHAAVTPNLFTPDPTGMTPLQQVAEQRGWKYRDSGILMHPQHQIQVYCYCDAFADLLHRCDVVVGMAGTAIEQAVGLGKPVIQIPSAGPQFIYKFAEAQMRLLGLSVQTIGTKPATPETIAQAARAICNTLGDRDYLERCRINGLERLGAAGGSAEMARIFTEELISSVPDRLDRLENV